MMNKSVVDILINAGMTKDEAYEQMKELDAIVAARAVQLLKPTDSLTLENLREEIVNCDQKEIESAWAKATNEIVPEYLKAIGIDVDDLKFD